MSFWMSRMQKNSRKAHNLNFSKNSKLRDLEKTLFFSKLLETLDPKEIENLESKSVKWPQSTYRIQKQFRAKNGETERQARESRTTLTTRIGSRPEPDKGLPKWLNSNNSCASFSQAFLRKVRQIGHESARFGKLLDFMDIKVRDRDLKVRVNGNKKSKTVTKLGSALGKVFQLVGENEKFRFEFSLKNYKSIGCIHFNSWRGGERQYWRYILW